MAARNSLMLARFIFFVRIRSRLREDNCRVTYFDRRASHEIFITGIFHHDCYLEGSLKPTVIALKRIWSSKNILNLFPPRIELRTFRV